MSLIKRIKMWCERRAERRNKEIEEKYGYLPLLVYAPMREGRKIEYGGGKTNLITEFFLEQERELIKKVERAKAYDALEKCRASCRHFSFGDPVFVKFQRYGEEDKQDET